MERRKVSTANKNSRRNNSNRSSNNKKPREADSSKARRDNDSPRGNVKKDSFNNILPPPNVLQEYEYATEGAADRILDMAQAEADRRKELEDEYLRYYKKNQRLGMIFGLVLLLSVVYGTVVLALNGLEVVAEILCVSAFFSFALSSYFSKKSRYVPARKRGGNRNRR